MSGRADRRGRLIGAFVAAALVAALLGGCGDGSAPSLPSAQTLAEQFLSRYVNSNGTVIRTDQGGDVVSEGEAYAMVLAEVAHQPTVVRTVWGWTKTHLRQSNGLLAWHAKSDGTVLDPQSAGDADVLAAWALLNYHGLGAAALAADGRALAQAVLAHETVTVGGQPVLVAGPWAAASPVTVNPSYWMPTVFRDIGTVTQDQRWLSMAAASVTLVGQLTSDGRKLPPDWARVSGSVPAPSGPPGTQGQPSYGLDAQRVPVWMGAACTQAARQLAAREWSLLREHSSAMTRGLDGSVSNSTATPLGEVAAAMAARAAGDQGSAQAAMVSAVSLAKSHPTYYGDAWVALGVAMYGGQAPAAC